MARVRRDLVGKVDVQVDFHTHLSRYGDSDRLRASTGDLRTKAIEQEQGVKKFIIITNPENVEY